MTMNEPVVAVYDSHKQAEEAVKELQKDYFMSPHE